MGISVRKATLVLCLVAVLAVGLFGGVSTALALTVTGPATFTARTPADGSSVGVVRPPISVKAFDPKGLAGSPFYSVKVDGALQTATFARTDANNITLSLTPRADLANGTHTVYVSVKNNSGVYSTTTWSFDGVKGPASLGTLAGARLAGRHAFPAHLRDRGRHHDGTDLGRDRGRRHRPRDVQPRQRRALGPHLRPCQRRLPRRDRHRHQLLGHLGHALVVLQRPDLRAHAPAGC